MPSVNLEPEKLHIADEPCAHGSDWPCAACRERELLDGINEWNRVAASIPAIRWQPFQQPEVRQ